MVLCLPCVAFPSQVRTATFGSVWDHLTQTLCETLRLCVRRKYALVFLCQKKSHTHTDWHRVYSASLLVFSQQIKQITQNSVLQSHRVICIITLINKHCLRKSALSAWDKYVPHGSVGSVCCFPLTSSDSDFQFHVILCPTPQGIRVNSCPLVAHKIPVDTRQSVENFLCLPWILCKTKSLRIPCSLHDKICTSV